MSELASLLATNASAAADFIDSGLPAGPRRRLAILTCMDARVEPLRMFGLDLGEAHVIRNAGGRASDDAIRSLALARALLGVETAMVIHHTDCRLRGVEEAALRDALRDAGAEVAAEFAFLPLPAAIADGVREDVARLRGAALIPPGLSVHGLVYDVRTGLVAEVPE